MKKMKKYFALFVALAMVLGTMSLGVFAAQNEGKTASITINTDTTYEGSNQEYTYKAYKVFDASYDSLTGTWTQANKDANNDIAYTPDDAAVAYFMKTGNPWISTVQGLTTYFTVTAAADGSGYIVVPKDDFNSTTMAKDLATALKTALPSTLTGDYEGIAITANGTAVSVQPGYYLIVGDTAENLALVTTDVTIVEKNEYPHIVKEFTDAKAADDKTDADSANADVQIGDTVSYTLTVTIPSGANQEMVVKDTFTSGLEPKVTNGKVDAKVDGLIDNTKANVSVITPATATEDAYFTVTLDAETVAANAGKEFTIVYEAVVTADAWYQTEINTGEVKYGNDYTSKTDRVESETTEFELDKKANAEDGADLGGAKFEVLVGGTYDSNTKKVSGATTVNLVQLSDEDLTTGGITKAEKTIYYRVADKNDATGVIKTEIDMTEKDGDNFKYTKAVVYGLDGDLTYYARETLAPTGFNLLDYDVQMNMADDNHLYNVVNKSGSVLPSTGGIGTTIFYVLGTILVLAAGVLLVTRRRMRHSEE